LLARSLVEVISLLTTVEEIVVHFLLENNESTMCKMSKNGLPNGEVELP
jgi:hypothetical protein